MAFMRKQQTRGNQPMPTDSTTPVTVVPIQYAGQWIAWDQTGTRIVASGRTIDEALRGAEAAGEKEPVLAKVPKSGGSPVSTFHGGIRKFSRRDVSCSFGWSDTPQR
jgi:Family of unknown function (DUF5678)